MLHLYTGPDDFRMREAYTLLRASLDVDGMLETNTTLLPPRGLRVDELIQHAMTAPFMAEARVVVVEGLLTMLGTGRNVVAAWQPLLDVLPQLPPTNHVVLLEPVPTREQAASLGRSALARELRAVENIDAQEFRQLRTYGRGGDEVAAWVRERVSTLALQIEPQAVDELVSFIGADLWALSAELAKLGRYANGRTVTAEDVRLLTPEAREAGIFDVVDAVVEGRAAPALRLIRKMLTEGTEPPARIQSMIARQLRHLVRATELLEAHATEQAIGEATGVTNNFARGKLVRQARATTRAAAEAGLREVEASDHAVKTGKLNDELALELLVTRLASPAPHQR